jgi:hypothetical protein
MSLSMASIDTDEDRVVSDGAHEPVLHRLTCLNPEMRFVIVNIGTSADVSI